MKYLWTTTISALVIGSLLIFQNCGSLGSSIGGKGSSSASSSGLSAAATEGSGNAGVFSTSENVITIGANHTLTFTNNMGSPIGMITPIASDNPDQNTLVSTFVLYSAASGRRAVINIVIDSNSFTPIAIQPASGQPYMCHDSTADICANYPNAMSGAMESNCNSAIFYSGALNGSVNNLTDTAYKTYCANSATAAPTAAPTSTAAATPTVSGSPPSTATCQFELEGGGSGSTANQTFAACQKECRQNAKANPSRTVSCTFGGQSISY